MSAVSILSLSCLGLMTDGAPGFEGTISLKYFRKYKFWISERKIQFFGHFEICLCHHDACLRVEL